MQFPVFQIPYAGNGMLIGLVAIFHVLISHGIAIGAFAVMVLIDWSEGRGKTPDAFAGFRRRLLTFIVYTTTTFGVLSGVGIWFTTTALAPRAIGSMLRIFFWPWFVEWAVFVAEVVVILIYWFHYDRGLQDRPKRLRLGVAYVILAVTSAVLITGNLSFMLTPGRWPAEQSLWNGFLNPTFLPQLCYRLTFAAMLGCLIAMPFALYHRGTGGPPVALPLAPSPGTPGEGRGEGPRSAMNVDCSMLGVSRSPLLRLLGLVLAISTPALVLSLWWYFATVPAVYSDHASFSVLTSRLSQRPGLLLTANALAAGIIILLALSALARRHRAAKLLILPALLMAALLAAEVERMREFIRGPYLIPGYMYANGMLTEEDSLARAVGSASADAAASPYPARPHAAGAYLFSQYCSACHTIGGVNDIAQRVAGRSEDGLVVIVGHTHDIVPFMPPFPGNDAERRALAAFLFQVGKGRVNFASLSRHITAEESTEGGRP